MPSEPNVPPDEPNESDDLDELLESLLAEEPTQRDEQLQSLQEALAEERDARKEERFIFIVLVVLLLDIVFFTVMPGFGGPIALLILQLLILIPLAKRMGMEEIAAIYSRVLGRMTDKAHDGE